MSEQFAAGAGVPCEVQAANLIKKLDDNPALRVPATALLDACAGGRREEIGLLAEVGDALKASGDLPVQPLSAVVALLVRAGALSESLEIDGEPYAGTLEDAFGDESIPDGAEALIFESITEAGKAARANLDPARRTAALFDERPEHRAAFIRTLELCDVPGGLPTRELQEGLDADGLLHRDERTNIPHIYPSLYANLLKDVGCLAWDHAWVTTDLGRAVLGQAA